MFVALSVAIVVIDDVCSFRLVYFPPACWLFFLLYPPRLVYGIESKNDVRRRLVSEYHLPLV
uniref:Uncharacterized protein n=1 Tax=Lutzomyia longipalpis TaxID=7200 RepID=A0A1B0CVB2_LUTLO